MAWRHGGGVEGLRIAAGERGATFPVADKPPAAGNKRNVCQRLRALILRAALCLTYSNNILARLASATIML